MWYVKCILSTRMCDKGDQLNLNPIVISYGLCQTKMCLQACTKCTVSDSSHTCTKSHPGICSSLRHSIVSNDFVGRQCRLIWAFIVRIFLKTHFCMVWPIWKSVKQCYNLFLCHQTFQCDSMYKNEQSIFYRVNCKLHLLRTHYFAKIRSISKPFNWWLIKYEILMQI